MAQAPQERKIRTKAEALAEIERIEKESGMPRWLRDAVIAALPVGHEGRRKIEAIEEQIAKLRGR
jgi:hypothetical protein